MVLVVHVQNNEHAEHASNTRAGDMGGIDKVESTGHKGLTEWNQRKQAEDDTRESPGIALYDRKNMVWSGNLNPALAQPSFTMFL